MYGDKLRPVVHQQVVLYLLYSLQQHQNNAAAIQSSSSCVTPFSKTNCVCILPSHFAMMLILESFAPNLKNNKRTRKGY